MGIGYLLSVYLHVVLAAFWIGGMLFLPLVILPGIRQHPDRIAILYKTGLAFRFYGWIALTLLVVTGVLNLYLRGLPLSWAFFTESGYGRLFGLKMLLFLTMLLVSAVHDFFLGRKALEQMQAYDSGRLRLLARWSGRINLLLALGMAFLGVILSRGAAI